MGRWSTRSVAMAIIAGLAVIAGALGVALVLRSTPASTASATASPAAASTSPVLPSPSATIPAPSTPRPPILGGTWTGPAAGAKVQTTTLKLGATPTARLSEAAINKVTFKIGWSGATSKTACTAIKPPSGAEWSCIADLAKLGAPFGDLTLGFDVVDDAGDVTHSPDGVRSVAYAAPSAWSKPVSIGKADCSAVTASIDSASRSHIAATCGGSIRYSVSAADGSWSTTTFSHPGGREDRDPQIAIERQTAYVAFTRVAVAQNEGCGSGEDITDIGVYYRQRDLPDGAWSGALRLGEEADQISALRVDSGTLHAIVRGGADGREYYETQQGDVNHRSLIADAVGGLSLRIGDDGQARIAYVADGSLRYATFTGSSFTTAKIADSRFGGSPVLVLGKGNQPHLLWTNDSQAGGGCALPDPDPGDGTYYATNANGTWAAERISKLVGPTSLTLDVDSGRIHVLVGGDGLRYYTKAPGGDWTSTRLTSAGIAGVPVIRLDPATGTLLVAYIDGGDLAIGRVRVMTKP